jgi:hypothetical protein
MHAITPLLSAPQAASPARCQALFASAVQPSDTPDGGRIAAAISSAMQRLGPRGCTALMAQESGDHPDSAARRMRWARRLAALEARAVSARARSRRALWRPADPACTRTLTEKEHTS